MFGHSFFGTRWYGDRYYGPQGSVFVGVTLFASTAEPATSSATLPDPQQSSVEPA